MPYYAVAKGHCPGVYRHWSDCKRQVIGFSGSDYRKKFCYEDARRFLSRRRSNISYDCGNYGDYKDNSKYYYYAIAIGKNPGIYHMSWYDCEDEVRGFPGAEYRKFFCRHDARSFMSRRCPANEYKEYSDDEEEDSDETSSGDSSDYSNSSESSSEFY